MNDMPLMGLGTFIGLEHNQIDDAQQRKQLTIKVIVTALQLGYRHLDLATGYNNLPAVAEALQKKFNNGE